MDFNRVWLCGVAQSDPILTRLPKSNTPTTSFNLEVVEYFKDKSGLSRGRGSIFVVESVGANAEKTLANVRTGKRYWVEGYLRQEIKNQKEIIKIRTYFIQEDSTYRSVNYRNGVNQALEILKRSPDIASAIVLLEEVLSQS